ncbi:hypothetical protein, partial [Pseudomonas carnis]
PGGVAGERPMKAVPYADGREKMKQNQLFSVAQKPQLACRHDGLHASCTISKIHRFHNSLFINEFNPFGELAHCLQYPW